jgi:WD40 repeat protein
LASTNQISSSLKTLLEDSQQALVIARKSRDEAENNAMRAEQAVQKMKEAGELARKDRERADLEMDEANAQAEEAHEYFRSIRSMIKHNKKQSRHHIAKDLKSNTRIGTVAKEASELAKKDSHLEMDEADAQAEEAFEHLLSSRSMSRHEKQPKLANAISMMEATSSTLHANESSSKRSEDCITTGKFSTESRRCVSKKDDKTKQDETLIEPVHKFQGHEAPITQVAAIDRVHFISSSWDKTVRLWNADTGECKQIFQGHKDWIQSICKLPDNEHFISGSDDRTLKLWNINRPECLRTFCGHGSFVKSIATMSGGRFLSGSRDRKIKLWQTSSDQCMRTFDGHDDVITAIVSLDSKHFVSGSHDKSIRCWNAKTGECVRTMRGQHTGPIKTLAAVSDNSRNVESLIVSGDDKSIRLWDVFNGVCLHEFDCSVSIFSLTSICEGFFLSSGGNKIQLYHLASRKVVKSYETPRISLAVARLDDDRFITGSDQVLQVWKF